MAGYPQGSGHPYGEPPANPYGASQPSNPYGATPPANPYGTSSPANPYGAAPPANPYGAAPPANPYGAAPPANPYGAAPTANPYGYGGQQPSAPYSKPDKPGKTQGGGGGYDQQHPPANPYGTAPPANPYGYGGPQSSAPYSKPEKPGKVQGGGGYDQPAPTAAHGAAASPFSAILPSVFPPGTDPSVVACFKVADQDGSGIIDDKELQRALSSYNQSFSLRTVHLLMYLFTSSNVNKIGPKEFTSLFYSLQSWRVIFERFDRDRSGKIDASELREALLSLGYAVPPPVLDLLLMKFDKSGGKNKAIEYDNFIESCLTVKGLTEKFKENDKMYNGSATFTYESFMLAVLPFLIA